MVDRVLRHLQRTNQLRTQSHWLDTMEAIAELVLMGAIQKKFTEAYVMAKVIHRIALCTRDPEWVDEALDLLEWVEACMVGGRELPKQWPLEEDGPVREHTVTAPDSECRCELVGTICKSCRELLA